LIGSTFLRLLYWQHILSRKWLISFFVFTILSSYSVMQIMNYTHSTGKMFNIFDAYFYQFGLHMYLFIVIAPLYLILISSIFTDTGIDNYIYIRFNNKRYVWLNKMILLFAITGTYILMATLINVIIGSFSLEMGISWSEGAKTLEQLLYIADFNFMNDQLFTISPILVMLTSLLLLYLYLFFLGVLAFIASFLFKKSIFGLALGLSVNLFIFGASKLMDASSIHPFMPFNKILIKSHDALFSINLVSSAMGSIAYWAFFIGIAVFIFWAIFQKSDYIFEVKDSDN
jgi:hypothetical protein